MTNGKRTVKFMKKIKNKKKINKKRYKKKNKKILKDNNKP